MIHSPGERRHARLAPSAATILLCLLAAALVAMTALTPTKAPLTPGPLATVAGSPATVVARRVAAPAPVSSAAEPGFPTPSLALDAAVTPAPAPAPRANAVLPAQTCSATSVCRHYRVAETDGLALTPFVACGSGQRCRLDYDLFRPVGSGPWPLVVLSPGGPAKPASYSYLRWFARILAGQGAVVVLAAWREGARYGAPPTLSFGDIGCAIRTARKIAPSVGANPNRVTLVGHSMGAYGAAVAVLSPRVTRPASGTCPVTSGSAMADAFVGIAGPYSDINEGATDVDWDEFVGGSRASRPAAWRAANPMLLAQATPTRRVPVVLIHGTADRNVPIRDTRSLASALQARGWNVDLVLSPGKDHSTVMGDVPAIAAIMRVLNRG